MSEYTVTDDGALVRADGPDGPYRYDFDAALWRYANGDPVRSDAHLDRLAEAWKDVLFARRILSRGRKP